MLFTVELELACEFIKGLTLQLHLEIEYLIAIGSFFPQIVNHTRTINRAYIETYGGGDKRLSHRYNVSSTSVLKEGVLPTKFNITYIL